MLIVCHNINTSPFYKLLNAHFICSLKMETPVKENHSSFKLHYRISNASIPLRERSAFNPENPLHGQTTITQQE